MILIIIVYMAGVITGIRIILRGIMVITIILTIMVIIVHTRIMATRRVITSIETMLFHVRVIMTVREDLEVVTEITTEIETERAALIMAETGATGQEMLILDGFEFPGTPRKEAVEIEYRKTRRNSQITQPVVEVQGREKETAEVNDLRRRQQQEIVITQAAGVLMVEITQEANDRRQAIHREANRDRRHLIVLHHHHRQDQTEVRARVVVPAAVLAVVEEDVSVASNVKPACGRQT